MVEMTVLQLVGIIIGALIVGGLAGLFAGCLLTMASQADAAMEKHWMEDETR